MAKYFSLVDYFATGEGRFTNIAGGYFEGEDEFYKYLERKIDPFYLKFVNIYTYDTLTKELQAILEAQYSADLDQMINGSGVYRFMHESYLNAF